MAKARKPNSIFIELPRSRQSMELSCPSSFNKNDRAQIKRMIRQSRSSVAIEEEFQPNKIYFQISVRKVREKPLVFSFARKGKSVYVAREYRKGVDLFHILKELCL